MAASRAGLPFCSSSAAIRTAACPNCHVAMTTASGMNHLGCCPTTQARRLACELEHQAVQQTYRGQGEDARGSGDRLNGTACKVSSLCADFAGFPTSKSLQTIPGVSTLFSAGTE